MDFQPGQRVSLIGYGIPMTIESVEGDNVTATRYDAKGKRISEVYKAAALKPFQPPKPITFRF
jgi:hypothetical protein